MNPSSRIGAIIIDDEQPCMNALTAQLKYHFSDIDVLQTCASAEDGLKAIAAHRPDIVFLDIYMPGTNGFELLEKLEDISFEIIFTTAFDNYAVRAFQVNALNYLLKPVNDEDLIQTINRYKDRLHQQTSLQQLASLLDSMRNAQRGIDKIAIPTYKGYRFALIQDIIRLEADGNYTMFHFIDGSKLVVSKSLKEYETILGGPSFIRVHNSHMINLCHMKEYINTGGGFIQMTDGAEIEVSVRKKSTFLERVGKFLRPSA